MPKLQVPKRSPIWIYFNEVSSDVAKCTICGAVISTKGGSTSNLRRHLKGKHRKIIIERTKSKRSSVKETIKGENLKREEDQIVEEELIAVKSYPVNSFHSEVLFHDYAAVEVEIDPSQNEPSSSDWEQRKTVNKSNSRSRNTPYKKLENTEEGVDKAKNINNSSSINNNNNNNSNVNNKKLEVFTEMAFNLGRIATAFERIADVICTDANQKRYNCDSSGRLNENANDELGAKVNDMILNVLGEEIVNGSDIEYNIGEHVNEKLKTSSLLKSLNLLPKNEANSKSCKTSGEC